MAYDVIVLGRSASSYRPSPGDGYIGFAYRMTEVIRQNRMTPARQCLGMWSFGTSAIISEPTTRIATEVIAT